MHDVKRVIADETSRWGTTAIEESVFGTGDAFEIAGLIDAFCRTTLDSAPIGAHFYRSSVGCVIGLRLHSGQDVVLKAYQERWGKGFLRAVARIQGHLAEQGFCCATPLVTAEPIPGRLNLVVAESWWPDPGMTPVAGPRAQAISADGLARQIALCRGLSETAGLTEQPQQGEADDLYPEPHSPLFDFIGTAASAEWIDELGARGAEQRGLDQSPVLVAHTDWSARNVRITDHLAAVYDWDSLSLVTESTAVGHSATIWSVTSEPGGSAFPTAPEIASYIRDYESASGSRLSEAQWNAAGGAATWLLAYIARCEHSLAVTGRARPDQHGATERLRQEGAHLLALESLRSAH